METAQRQAREPGNARGGVKQCFLFYYGCILQKITSFANGKREVSKADFYKCIYTLAKHWSIQYPQYSYLSSSGTVINGKPYHV